MSDAAGPRGASRFERLRALWRARPPVHSRAMWALLLALDLAPWPLGEDACAGILAAGSLVRPARRRRAVEWARGQPAVRSPRRLAVAACAFRGRWVARSALVGIRRPEDLVRRVEIQGVEHLRGSPAGTLLLGFHLGPPNADVALRLAGHRLAWLGSRRTSRAWMSPAWRPLLDPGESLSPPRGERVGPGLLYRARRMLLDGGTVFVMADGWSGRELFRVTVPGGEIAVRSGWLMLQRQTGAAVVPVLTHLEGRTQVIVFHPPLPFPEAGDEAAPWREPLTALVRAHAARFPEQCPALLFPQAPPPPARRPPAAGPQTLGAHERASARDEA